MYEAVRLAADNIDGVSLLSDHHLNFPERQICVAHCDLIGLQRLILHTNALSGFRYNRVQSGFFDSLEPREQLEWQDDLLDRINFDLKNSSVCIMDTGLYKEHPLLQNAIREGSVDSFHPEWQADDHHGHGTEMAGLALMGDLAPILASQQRYDVKHYLESVKVFPRTGRNQNDHVATITEQSVYRAETNNPTFNRVFCLSWTVSPEEANEVIYHQGQPSALSAKIDQLSFASESLEEWRVDDNKKRLFFVSAGNIQDRLQKNRYPDQNDVSEVEEPAQSWNAITVGAYTNKVWINDPSYNGWEPIAQPGELSPLSRTSVIWRKKSWPIKPDIVLEGGNYVINPPNHPMDPPDLHVLTTGKDRPFCHSSDTSAANAQAARLGAIIRAEYPDYWPETVRGLLVHAARWPQGMLQQAAIDLNRANMQKKINLLRRYGYGVPDEDFIISSFSNQPNIVIQDYLRPFKRGVDSVRKLKSYASYNEMNFYALPWPKEQLEQLFDARVKLRVTLSYFIEPNPSERPPKTKYSYASHDLRFKIQRAGEGHEQFLQRINAELAEDKANENNEENVDAATEETSRSTDNWLLGPKVRDRGSVISDVWSGTATDLASQNMLAVVPQGGWWKHRLEFPDADCPRHGEQVRFSLIISLECDQDIDIYTPITQKISTRTLVTV